MNMIIKSGWYRTPLKMTPKIASALSDLVDRIDYVYARTDGTYGNLDVCVADKIKYIKKLFEENQFELGEEKLSEVLYKITFYNNEKDITSFLCDSYNYLKVNLNSIYDKYKTIYVDRLYYYAKLQYNGRLEIVRTNVRRLWSKGHYSELGVNLGDKK